MTIQDLINWFNINGNYILYYFIIIFILTIVCVLIVNERTIGKVKYVMSFLVYAVCVPGILAFFLSLYTILFLRRSMLDVGIISYFVPIIAMVISLMILNKKIKISKLPGFTRLSSLFIMIGISFIILFILQKTFFGVLIFGGFTQLLLTFIIIMIILKVAWTKFIK